MGVISLGPIDPSSIFPSNAASASLFWTPKGRKWANLLLDYSRSSVSSEHPLPGSRDPYADAVHLQRKRHELTVVARVVHVRGSLFTTSGSRPTQYYQPLARFSLFLNKYLWWNTEWRWYSMSEPFDVRRLFGANQIDARISPGISQVFEQHTRMRALEGDRNQLFLLHGPAHATTQIDMRTCVCNLFVVTQVSAARSKPSRCRWVNPRCNNIYPQRSD